MADKSFGVKDVNLIGASGTPTIESPNNLNINAVNVAISTDITIGGQIGLGGANYGTSGQVLSSGGPGAGVTWTNGFVTGMIMMFSGTTAPTGWVLCDNSAEAQAAGAPDLRDRFIVGATIGGNTTYPGVGVGSTGGNANAVVAAHDHPNNFSITANSYAYRSNSDTQDDIGTSSVNIKYSTPTLSGGVQTRGLDADGNENNDQSGTNANLPPYYALAFIMKT